MPLVEDLDRDVFMHTVGADETGRVRAGSAADSSQHRWEHIAWLVEFGCADLLYQLCNMLWKGELQTQDLGFEWIRAGRTVCIRKDGDAEDQEDLDAERKLRPLGIGSVFLRIIGVVAAVQHKDMLSSIFDPDDEGLRNGPWSPLQAGVACEGGAQQVQHTVQELLSRHSAAVEGRAHTLDDSFLDTWGVLLLDQVNAFNNCSRPEFLRTCFRRAPGLFRWVLWSYGSPSPRYVRMEDGSSRIVWSTSGSTQGDPLGPALYAFAVQQLIEDAQAHIPGALLFYLDDGTICGRIRDLVTLLALLTADGDDADTNPDLNLEARTGAGLNYGKSIFWCEELIEWELPADVPASCASPEWFLHEPGDPCRTARAAAVRAFLRTVFPPRVHRMLGLREPGHSCGALGHADPAKRSADIFASRGLVVLGSPVCGTSDYVSKKLQDTVRKAGLYVARAQEVLLPEYPVEYLQLMRSTLGGRFQHHCLTVDPDTLQPAAQEFDELVCAALRHAGLDDHGDHLPVQDVRQLSASLGGEGHQSVRRHADANYFGAHGLSRSRIVRRVPAGTLSQDGVDALLRGGVMHSAGALSRVYARVAAQHSELRNLRADGHVFFFMSPERARHFDLERILPEHARHALSAMAALPTLQQFDQRTFRDLSSRVSACFHTLDFFRIVIGCVEGSHGTLAGAACLIDQATRGARSWIRARPVGPEELVQPTQRFAEQEDVVTAHQYTCLQRPVTSGFEGCRLCGEREAYGSDSRHIATCPCGVRSQSTLHNPVRDLLCAMFRSVVGASRVLCEPWAHAVYSSEKRPDIVIVDWFGRQRHLLLDVKTFDPTGNTHLREHRTWETPLGAHQALESGLMAEYTRCSACRDARDSGAGVCRRCGGTRHVPNAIGRNVLRCAAVSSFGSVGPQLDALICSAAARRADRLPSGLRVLPSDPWSFAQYWRHRISQTAAVSISSAISSAAAPPHLASGMAADRRRASGGSAHAVGQSRPPRATGAAAAAAVSDDGTIQYGLDADGLISDCLDASALGARASSPRSSTQLEEDLASTQLERSMSGTSADDAAGGADNGDVFDAAAGDEDTLLDAGLGGPSGRSSGDAAQDPFHGCDPYAIVAPLSAAVPVDFSAFDQLFRQSAGPHNMDALLFYELHATDVSRPDALVSALLARRAALRDACSDDAVEIEHCGRVPLVDLLSRMPDARACLRCLSIMAPGVLVCDFCDWPVGHAWNHPDDCPHDYDALNPHSRCSVCHVQPADGVCTSCGAAGYSWFHCIDCGGEVVIQCAGP